MTVNPKYFTHGSFFSGIGGFDVAAEWMGWENIFHCDNNPFSGKILSYYWPQAAHYTDITKTNFKKHENTVSIVSGGFPCQPFSASGKRKGINDERYLWAQMLRAVDEVQPRWVVGENVHGIINWSKGLVFDTVQTDLETAGYQVWTYVLPAISVNAPHVRERVFFIAHANGRGLQIQHQKPGHISRIFEKASTEFAPGSFTQWNKARRGSGQVCADDGLPGRLDGITVSKHKRESIKAFGNSVVPHLAHMIFKAIYEYELLH